MIVRSLLVGAALLAICTGRDVDARQPRPFFTDVAAKSPFSYVTRNDYRSRKYFIQPLAGGVAILDYDNDGRMDIFFTNGAELPSMRKPAAFANALLRNRGAGLFEDRTAAAGLTGGDQGYHLGAAAGDFDNDGDTDLFLANAGANTLLRNAGDGTFTDATAGSGLSKPSNTLSVGAAWFDYDNDSLLDLVVADYTIWTPGTDFQCANAEKQAIYCSPTRYISVPNRLYRNLGNGKFDDVTDAAGLGTAHGKGMGVSIADVNNDNLPDIFIVNDTERNFVFINQGGGKFKEQGAIYGVSFNDDGIAVNGMGSDAKDFNNDGFVDLFYNNLATGVRAVRQRSREGIPLRQPVHRPRPFVVSLWRLGRGVHRLRQRRLEGFVFRQRRRRLSGRQCEAVRYDVAQSRRQVIRRCVRGHGAGLHAKRVSSRFGIRRPERRRRARYRGDGSERAASHFDQRGIARGELAVARPARYAREPRCRRRAGQAHQRVGTRAPQPCLGIGRVDVVFRSSCPFRPRSGELDRVD
ncbi:MAG: VCBS repeat-containing protein [Cyanobacteria bacterium]|nr:VCBS repeat-containing protein [Cyanobacteriota bacterium]